MAELNETQKIGKDYFDYLRTRETECLTQLKNIRNIIETSQKLCEHSFEHTGNNHNDDIEKCIICGKEQTY
ncbi:MAG: hypothetical protein DI598_19695 [Pseudopedobacter saltans]|uniref:Uncharacterized protein n=1 Tax=Pseudopedobacter saltans TaxID=151895 RepID=A0A2W5E6H2_9SPHI|nr:MAG: hypothetical protein DI598_19695 [Pseudopedobacter saltans]